MEKFINELKAKTETISMELRKFSQGNDSAGTRARKLALEIKEDMLALRKTILEERKNKND
jgi:hypothetical protein